MIVTSGLLGLLAMDGSIGRFEGACLLIGIVAYTALLIYLGRRKAQQPPKPDDGDAPQAKKTKLWLAVLLVVVGLVMLVLGARWLVEAAVDLARMLGVSELMIGLTIVAAGTSMPEVATSVVASIRGERADLSTLPGEGDGTSAPSRCPRLQSYRLLASGRGMGNDRKSDGERVFLVQAEAEAGIGPRRYDL